MGVRVHSEIEIAADDPPKGVTLFAWRRSRQLEPIAKSIEGWDTSR
jgi:hypothetical protein